MSNEATAKPTSWDSYALKVRQQARRQESKKAAQEAPKIEHTHEELTAMRDILEKIVGHATPIGHNSDGKCMHAVRSNLLMNAAKLLGMSPNAIMTRLRQADAPPMS